MSTPCDRCGNAEAAIHFTQIQNNETTTRHLCEACAAALGLDPCAGATAPLADFLAQMGKAMAEGLLSECDHEGRLPEARRGAVQMLVGMIESRLA